MNYEEGRIYTRSDFALIEVRHQDIGIGERNDDNEYDEWTDVVEVRGDAYHQRRDDSNYGRTVCGRDLYDYVLVHKEVAAKLLPDCQDGCWPIEMKPPLESSIMGNPVQDTSEPLKEMV